MADLFVLAMPWWEFLLRAVVVYAVLLTLVRLSGKRTVGQYTPFDLVLIALLGNAVQNSLLGEDHSLLGGLLLVATLIGLNWLIGVVSARSKKLDQFFAGEPVVLGWKGKVSRKALRKANVSQADFEEAMREHECTKESEIELALLETNGNISIIKHEQNEASAPKPHRK